MTTLLRKTKTLTGIMLSLLLSTSVWAGGITNVNSIKISGLDHFRGLMLSVFYVNARPAGFGTQGSQPRVRDILKIAGPFEIHGNGEAVTIPSTAVVAEGYKIFNYAYFVVHSPYLDEVGIRNVDGSIPPGQKLQRVSVTGDDNNPFNHRYVFFASRLDLHREADKSTGVVNLNVNPKLINYTPISE